MSSGGSRRSPKGGGGGGAFEGLTMNVEFCEDNSGRSKKMRCFRKITGWGILDPPLVSIESCKINCAVLYLNFSIGISNITRSKDEQGRRIVQYDIEERVTLFGFYESSANFRVTATVIQENAVIQNTAKLMGGLLQTKQTWRLSDSENGGEEETLLED